MQSSFVRQLVLANNFFTSSIPLGVSSLPYNVYLDLSGAMGFSFLYRSYVLLLRVIFPVPLDASHPVCLSVYLSACLSAQRTS